jgi:ketosteroid isomerase-like protein
MSQENVEIVRKLIQKISDARYGDAAAYLHPDAEWHNTRTFPGPTTVLGASAIQEFWRDLFGAYGGERSDSGMEVESVAHASDVVAVLVHGWGRGRGSQIPIDTRWAHTLRIRDSKVQRIDTYGRFDDALEAVGLSE